SVYDFGLVDDVAYIIYDYVEGPDLAAWARQNMATPKVAANIGIKLARALQHAHQRGVVHRDLKPANVLIDHAGEPHITDFGLAKQTRLNAGPSPEDCIVGTPAYMSPEQLRGVDSEIGPRADINALGAILYELLTGIR